MKPDESFQEIGKLLRSQKPEVLPAPGLEQRILRALDRHQRPAPRPRWPWLLLPPASAARHFSRNCPHATTRRRADRDRHFSRRPRESFISRERCVKPRCKTSGRFSHQLPAIAHLGRRVIGYFNLASASKSNLRANATNSVSPVPGSPASST